MGNEISSNELRRSMFSLEFESVEVLPQQLVNMFPNHPIWGGFLLNLFYWPIIEHGLLRKYVSSSNVFWILLKDHDFEKNKGLFSKISILIKL